MSKVKNKVSNAKKFKPLDHPAIRIVLIVLAVVVVLILFNLVGGKKEPVKEAPKTIGIDVDDAAIKRRAKEMEELQSQLKEIQDTVKQQNNTQQTNAYQPNQGSGLLPTSTDNKQAAEERKKRLTANGTVFDEAQQTNLNKSSDAENDYKKMQYQGKYDTFRDAAPKTVTSSPSVLAHPDWTLAKNAMIRCILQPAVNTDIQSGVKCVVETDAYSFQGDNVLVPKGSVIYGRYSNQLANGDASDRIFFAWDRILTPDGISMNITGEAKDPTGTAGVEADEVNHHYALRYSKSLLFSFINATISVGSASLAQGGEFNAASQYAMTMGNSFQQQAAQDLSGNNIKATLKLYAGHEIYVEAQEDLDFYSAYHS
ncbi:TraB/TrbI/VirB10 family type IV secretion system protein [Francisella philomiragia]|uniref:TrbI/VirB10 family protein n=1 Tax=Francisella philomiragia TaxID=28110 RepID=UPI0019040523|nr:TrbI/VirB10 family protein [Francisella philomiragia]MBK2257575.1 hypothetical protein [Francisella philomiragia]MBK2270305.1 hypothetical protein [Francisella philomiragia]MBK2272109.1 hypothetical protein [Francisella philomiragia]MBK2275948.1 hypothetical protein [Francisella philomiragia]MBK2295491.1 hypothetical protein [Francisella philomiragia]